MSEKCQERTHAPQQTSLFDHVVGAHRLFSGVVYLTYNFTDSVRLLVINPVRGVTARSLIKKRTTSSNASICCQRGCLHLTYQPGSCSKTIVELAPLCDHGDAGKP